MTPRSLIDAALEAQAQRVIDARPSDLPACSSGNYAHTGSCLSCGGPLGSGNGAGQRNKSGYCSRNRECKTAQWKAAGYVRVRRPAKPAEPKFCGCCGKQLNARSTSGYCRTGHCRYQHVVEMTAVAR